MNDYTYFLRYYNHADLWDSSHYTWLDERFNTLKSAMAFAKTHEKSASLEVVKVVPTQVYQLPRKRGRKS